jgi:hypothetical protein
MAPSALAARGGQVEAARGGQDTRGGQGEGEEEAGTVTGALSDLSTVAKNMIRNLDQTIVPLKLFWGTYCRFGIDVFYYEFQIISFPIGSYQYILDCHLQIDMDPDPAYHFDADPDSASHFDADPDPTFQFDTDPDPQQLFVVSKKFPKKWREISL